MTSVDEPVSPGCRSGLLLPILFVICIAGIGATYLFGSDVVDQIEQAIRNQRVNPVPNRPVPHVSNRFFGSGTSSAIVTGALTLTDQLEIDPIASYAADGLVWISFHDAGSTEVLIVFNEPEDSVTVSNGSLVAIGRDDDCAFAVDVTEALVSGSITCESVGVLRDDENAGSASIQLQFSAVTDTSD